MMKLEGKGREEGTRGYKRIQEDTREGQRRTVSYGQELHLQHEDTGL
jgi:hypothetical protein